MELATSITSLDFLEPLTVTLNEGILPLRPV